MASQALNRFQTESPNVFMLRNILPGPGWAPYRALSPALERETEIAPKSSAEDGNPFKGMLVALGFEAAVVIVLYGAWQVLHLFR
ncbi:MAG: hypothetical protein ABSD67_18250 [Terracidiphilus sp.]|jgi:hypothetical protein